MLAFVLVIVWLTPRPDEDPVRPVDYSSSLVQARSAADYPVYAPEGLPPGWRATSARVSGGGSGVRWHVGLVTPQDRYAAVEQSAGPSEPFVREVSRDGRDEGAAQLEGVPWQRRYSAPTDQRTLWRSEGPSTVAVTGNAGWAELEQLARSLRGG